MADQAIENKDDFGDAFTKLLAEETAPAAGDTPPVDDKAAAGDPPPVDDKAAGDPPPVDDKAAAGDPPPVDDKAAAGDPPPVDDKAAAKETDDDVLQRLASLVKTVPKEEPAAKPAAVEAEAAAEIFNADEQKVLQDFQKDWPDVFKAQQLLQRGAAQQLVGYVFAEVSKELRPLAELVQQLAVKTQYSELKSEVPDYDNIQDAVVAWVDTQPDYLQTAYKQVIDGGTRTQVVDLINRFKAETGAKPKETPATPAAEKKKEPELPAATKQAVASLAPVGSKRSATAAPALDPNDFESAFQMFAEKPM